MDVATLMIFKAKTMLRQNFVSHISTLNYLILAADEKEFYNLVCKKPVLWIRNYLFRIQL